MPPLRFSSPPDTDDRSPEAVLECPPEMLEFNPVTELSKPPSTLDHVPEAKLARPPWIIGRGSVEHRALCVQKAHSPRVY